MTAGRRMTPHWHRLGEARIAWADGVVTALVFEHHGERDIGLLGLDTLAVAEGFTRCVGERCNVKEAP